MIRRSSGDPASRTRPPRTSPSRRLRAEMNDSPRLMAAAHSRCVRCSSMTGNALRSSSSRWRSTHVDSARAATESACDPYWVGRFRPCGDQGFNSVDRGGDLGVLVHHPLKVGVVVRRPRLQFRPHQLVLGSVVVMQCGHHEFHMVANHFRACGITGRNGCDQRRHAVEFAAEDTVNDEHVDYGAGHSAIL
jgi:hypothetical protein